MSRPRKPFKSRYCRASPNPNAYVPEIGEPVELLCPDCEGAVEPEPPESPKHNTIWRCPDCGRGMRRGSCIVAVIEQVPDELD